MLLVSTNWTGVIAETVSSPATGRVGLIAADGRIQTYPPDSVAVRCVFLTPATARAIAERTELTVLCGGSISVQLAFAAPGAGDAKAIIAEWLDGIEVAAESING
ncbi:hypothetical protein [Limobrevibacterium gyesilva]|uniref:Uncharacterized protein n=1 Tax=Limobrevibacterium gyesilva TaxID=2991712 RepID=A0AA42CG72_9PROT|nr:hypothetical protein [Limobrevibacterium gyesilva]MCW3477394.1 hypothetical protein [Limobrevibacterium gyesilva]